jgi:plasmid stability protein
MLPDDLKARATRKARSVGVSLGAFIRESLEKALDSEARQADDDPLLADDAVYEGSTEVDVAENHDEYLYGG